jgi:hypothetical protein
MHTYIHVLTPLTAQMYLSGYKHPNQGTKVVCIMKKTTVIFVFICHCHLLIRYLIKTMIISHLCIIVWQEGVII